MLDWKPAIVRPGQNEPQTVYLVLDDFADLGRVWREAGAEATNLEAVLQGLLGGHYNDPVRVVGFNTAERWSRDVSEKVAAELRRWCDRQTANVPMYLEGFIARHEATGRP